MWSLTVLHRPVSLHIIICYCDDVKLVLKQIHRFKFNLPALQGLAGCVEDVGVLDKIYEFGQTCGVLIEKQTALFCFFGAVPLKNGRI